MLRWQNISLRALLISRPAYLLIILDRVLLRPSLHFTTTFRWMWRTQIDNIACTLATITQYYFPSIPHHNIYYYNIVTLFYLATVNNDIIMVLNSQNFVFLKYSKTCLKRNAIVPVFFFPFSQVSVLQRVVF